MENVKLEKKNQIAYVTIDRPKVLNALNAATMSELQEVFTELAADREVRVVILTGAGEKSFVAWQTSTNWPGTIRWRQKHTPIAGRLC